MGLAPGAGRGGIQIKAGGERERRAFNPDRDLVWGLGRLVKRLGFKLAEQLCSADGVIDAEAYDKALRDRGIHSLANKQEQAEAFAEFIRTVNDASRSWNTIRSLDPATELHCATSSCVGREICWAPNNPATRMLLALTFSCAG